MAESKNTLAQGMFVRQHTYESGTQIMNVSINVTDFCTFAKEHINVDSSGTEWINLKFIPNKNVVENKLSHTQILNDYYTRNAERALEELANQTMKVKASPEEREITEAPAKKSKRKVVKKAIKKVADNLPF